MNINTADLHEEAGIAAAELVGCNALDYDKTWERIYEEMCLKAEADGHTLSE